MSNDIFERRRAALESSFFARKNVEALEEVRKLLLPRSTILTILTGQPGRIRDAVMAQARRVRLGNPTHRRTRHR